MLLVVDVGNTQTHFGTFRDDLLLEHWRFATVRTSTADELGAALRNLLELRGVGLADLSASIVSSTVPQLEPEWLAMAQHYLGHRMLAVGPGLRTSMAIRIDNPRELGADRLVNAVAAFEQVGGPCVSVDFGTAVNYDVVSSDGEYLGGVIAPGVEISLDALTSRGAKLPRIDLLPEMVRWWDRWLRGRTDLPEEPVVTYFMRRSTRPEPDLDSWAGEWRQEDWPSPRVGTRSLGLIGRRPYVVRPDVGTAAWISCAGHLPYGQPLDQRFDDAASLTWEWDADDVELLGHALLRLTVTASEPVGFVSAKLTDVFPDGTSALVTRGLLNLTHRNGHESPQPLQPGQPYDVEVELEATAFAFARGHRLRLSLAGADWPNTVAPPRPLVLEVRGGELLLPVVEEPSPYPPPRLVAAEGEPEAAEGVSWRVERDVLARETACLVDHGSGYETVHGTAAEHYRGRVSVDSRTFEQRAESDVSFTLTWPEATVSTRSTLEVRAGAEHFDVAVVLQVREGDDLVAERRWHRRIARDLA